MFVVYQSTLHASLTEGYEKESSDNKNYGSGPRHTRLAWSIHHRLDRVRTFLSTGQRVDGKQFVGPEMSHKELWTC